MQSVPFFDYSRMHQIDANKYMPNLVDVLNRSDYILRSDLEAFEQELAQFIGVKHVVGVGNGTDAIWLALIAAGVKPGDEVIIPSHTYIATADAVKIIGATPVLADCDVDHSISMKSIEQNFSRKTVAVIAVNLNGRAASLRTISDFCETKRIKLIEDNAQGLGARLFGKSTGTFGIAGTLSFFPAKNLGCLGDGGAVITNDDYFASKIKKLRNHGRDSSGEVVTWGVNSRLDNIQANILRSKLPYLTQSLETRRRYAQIYCDGLSGIDELRLPEPPKSDSLRYDSFQNFEIEAENRDAFRKFLAERGIGTLLPWNGKAIHQFELPGVRTGSLANTESLFQKVVLLPMNQYLSEEEITYIVQVTREFYLK